MQRGDSERLEGRGENQFLKALGSARGRPWIIAHRGDSAHAPENTIEALVKGHVAGADACEIDVHLSRDGQPVVIHDDSLLRTTDVAVRFRNDPRTTSGFRVRDFDYAEIRTLDAGSWFLKEKTVGRTASSFGTLPEITAIERARIASGEIRIPHLRECLEWVVAQRWLMNVEIKGAGAFEWSALEVSLAEIARCEAAKYVLISSFYHAVVSRGSSSGLGVAAGVLTEVSVDRPGRYVREVVKADTFNASAGLVLNDQARCSWPRHLENLRDHGVPVLAYTVNDTGVVEKLSDAGVDGVFTDDPGRLLRFLS